MSEMNSREYKRVRARNAKDRRAITRTGEFRLKRFKQTKNKKELKRFNNKLQDKLLAKFIKWNNICTLAQ